MLIDEANLKVAGIDEANLKAELAVRVGQRRKQLALRQSNSLLRYDRHVERRKLTEKYLLPALAPMGHDAREFETLCTRAREEARRAFQQQKSSLVADTPSIGAALRARLAARRQVASAAAPQFNFNFVVLDTPTFILPTSGISLGAWHKEPWNNTARLSGVWTSPNSENGWDELDFVFVWRNPASTYAVVNVESYLALNGFCAAWADGGVAPENWAGFGLHASLDVFEWWNQPPTVPPAQSTQDQLLNTPNAVADGFFDPGDYESAAIAGNYDVSYREFILPQQGVAVFSVSFGILHEIYGHGGLELDFSGGDFEVVCPAVVIAILS